VSHHGYIPIVKQRLQTLKHSPSIIEIGVDRGVTFLSLVTFLARTRPEFLAVGVDILVQESVSIQMQNLDLQSKQQSFLVTGNSLSVLPNMINQGMKFDVILLDGDHNYHTVSQEMNFITSLIRDDGAIIVDDYDGRWGDRDLFYHDRPGYEDVASATKPVVTEKHGVRPAVDEWLEKNTQWKKTKPLLGEPVMLIR